MTAAEAARPGSGAPSSAFRLAQEALAHLVFRVCPSQRQGEIR